MMMLMIIILTMTVVVAAAYLADHLHLLIHFILSLPFNIGIIILVF